MANIIIKSDERRADTNEIMRQYGVNASDSALREAAEIVAVRTREAMEIGHREERRYY